MRRIEGAPMIPSAHALLHDQLPHPSSVTRRNVVFEWIHNFQFRAKKIDVISRRVVHLHSTNGDMVMIISSPFRSHRVLFPSSFGVFNIMYWSYYLTQDNKKPD